MKKPYLIITSEQVPQEYLNYLDEQHISWIACGAERIDLARASEIHIEQFGSDAVWLRYEVGVTEVSTEPIERNHKSGGTAFVGLCLFSVT